MALEKTISRAWIARGFTIIEEQGVGVAAERVV